MYRCEQCKAHMTYKEYCEDDRCPQCIEENLEEDEDWDNNDNMYT